MAAWAESSREFSILGHVADSSVITSSEKNGPLILRHELGHTLIPVGDEYDGGGWCLYLQ